MFNVWQRNLVLELRLYFTVFLPINQHFQFRATFTLGLNSLHIFMNFIGKCNIHSKPTWLEGRMSGKFN
jgi:hypothetical protein